MYDPTGDSWGPTGQHTDLKFYSAADPDNDKCDTWLWERRDEYCDACAENGEYPSGDDYDYGAGYEAYYTEAYNEFDEGMDSYSFGSFDVTNQYDSFSMFEEEEEVPAPPAPEPEEEEGPPPSLYGEEYVFDPNASYDAEEY